MKVSVKGVQINCVHTDFAVMDFKDNIFIIITQFKKPGCFISAKKQGEGIGAVYSLTALLGDDEMYLPAARYIYEKLSLPRNTVFSIALKTDISKSVLDSLCDVLTEIKTW